MNSVNNKILILCDTEEEYAVLMGDFLRERRDLPWNVHTYTRVPELFDSEKNENIGMLVVAESAYTEELQRLSPDRIVILNESGVMKWDNLLNIDKYQRAENVLKELLDIYADIIGEQPPRLMADFKTKFIGIYSPVRRCLQTTFALTMSQMLAAGHRTLYLNFEHYSGLSELLPDMQYRDLADLLYFLNSDKNKFSYRMKAMVRHKGSLDYIPPMKSGQNLLTITPKEWQKLLQLIEESGDYDYVVLDLSESMQGLFDILRSCTKIFTVMVEDRLAKSKLLQYEQILALYEYGDVLEKTLKCSIPKIKRIPDEIEQYTKGDLAEFVKMQIKNL